MCHNIWIDIGYVYLFNNHKIVIVQVIQQEHITKFTLCMYLIFNHRHLTMNYEKNNKNSQY